MAFTLILFLSSCQNETPNNTSDSSEADTKNCYLALIADSTDVKWTAYKTNDRVPVAGTFNEIALIPNAQASSAMELLKGASFEINANTVNSGNVIRDPKLVTFFFGLIQDAMAIKGVVKTAEGDENQGTGTIELQFNGLKKPLAYAYQIADGVISLQAEMNMDDWNGTDAVGSLNTECYELHKGADGESRLWPDVNINVRAMYRNPCE